MKRFLALAGFALAVQACGSTSTPVSPVVQPAQTAAATLSSIAVTSSRSSFIVGDTAQLAVEATYSDGQKKDVTSQAKFESSAPAVLAVNAAGLVTALTPGTASISAVYLGVTGTLGTRSEARAYALSGTVVEPEPTVGRPVRSGTIEVLGGEFAGRVFSINSSGQFELTGVHAGGFDLLFKAPGYENVRYSVGSLSRDETVSVRQSPERQTISFRLEGPCSELPNGGSGPVFTFDTYHDGQVQLTSFIAPGWGSPYPYFQSLGPTNPGHAMPGGYLEPHPVKAGNRYELRFDADILFCSKPRYLAVGTYTR